VIETAFNFPLMQMEELEMESNFVTPMESVFVFTVFLGFWISFPERPGRAPRQKKRNTTSVKFTFMDALIKFLTQSSGFQQGKTIRESTKKSDT
jgi:hypothetical protein